MLLLIPSAAGENRESVLPSSIYGPGFCLSLSLSASIFPLDSGANRNPDRCAIRISPFGANSGLNYFLWSFDQAPAFGWAAPCGEPSWQHFPMPPLWAHFFPQFLSLLHIFALSPLQHFMSDPLLQQSLPQLSWQQPLQLALAEACLFIGHFAPIWVCEVWANATIANTSMNERKAIVRFIEFSFTLKMQEYRAARILEEPVAASFA
jgi:hypothetical protein